MRAAAAAAAAAAEDDGDDDQGDAAACCCLPAAAVSFPARAPATARPGNYCQGGRRGDEPGNGRVVVAEFNGKDGDDCAWDVLKVVEVPAAAYFKDYSGMVRGA